MLRRGPVRESAARLLCARAINKQRNRNNYVRWRTYFLAQCHNDSIRFACAVVCSASQRTYKDAKPAAGDFFGSDDRGGVNEQIQMFFRKPGILSPTVGGDFFGRMRKRG